MFCPNCGVKTEAEQSYCRACGVDVLDFSQALVEQMKNAESGERHLWFKRGATFLFAAFVTMSFVFAMALGLGNKVTFIFFALTLLGLLGGTTGVFIFEDCRSKRLLEDEKRKRRRHITITPKQATLMNELLNEPQDKRNLLQQPAFRPFSSITENTTDFFTSEIVGRKTSGELS